MASKGKILVVDDESSVRDLFDSVFTEAGYEVIPAEGGKEALTILQIQDIDVIFLDLKLFGMNGIELCREIRKTKPLSMIYAITGWSAPFEIAECRNPGLMIILKNRWRWICCFPLLHKHLPGCIAGKNVTIISK